MKYSVSLSGNIIPMLLSVIAFLAVVPEGIVKAQSQDNAWQTLSTETEPHHRAENAFAQVGDKLYLLGGRGERPVNIYDPADNTWSTGATPPLPMHHVQAVTYNDKIYVIGALTGGFPGEDPIPNVYIYDPETDAWTEGPAIPENRRRGAAAAVVHNDKIYVVGGIQNGHIDGHVRWFDSFDPQSGEWQQLPDTPRYRDHFQVAVVDNKLYAAGGRRTSQATGQVFNLTIPEVDVYDFATGEWSPLPPAGDLPTERAGTSTIAVGKHVIVLGGESGTQQAAHDEVEAYNTETGEWEALPRLNMGRHGTQAVVYNGKIYISAGSKVRGAQEISSTEVLEIPEALQN